MKERGDRGEKSDIQKGGWGAQKEKRVKSGVAQVIFA